jgi:hypothetical protein
MDYYTLADRLEELVEEIVNDTTPVPAEKLGLDSRCGPILIGNGFIASMMPRQLDYFGGFEYVDAEYRRVIGGLVVYSDEHDRVQNVLEAYEASIS